MFFTISTLRNFRKCHILQISLLTHLHILIWGWGTRIRPQKWCSSPFDRAARALNEHFGLFLNISDKNIMKYYICILFSCMLCMTMSRNMVACIWKLLFLIWGPISSINAAKMPFFSLFSTFFTYSQYFSFKYMMWISSLTSVISNY